MDTLDNISQEENSLFGSTELKSYIVETAKWGKFLAIMGYVGIGILLLIAVVMMAGLSQLSKLPNAPFPMAWLGFIYIVIAALYFFPVNYLFQFSVQIGRGLKSNDMQTVTSAFGNLKSMFKFMGVCTIIVLSIYGLILLFAVGAAMF